VMRNKFPIVQYACAVCLIISSIMMVAYQVLTIADVANGLLMYVAQAFLLAGSIFGLDYYVKQLRCLNENTEQARADESSLSVCRAEGVSTEGQNQNENEKGAGC